MRLRDLGSLAVLALAACAHPAATGGERPPSPAGPGERIVTVEGKAGRLRASDGGSGEPALVFVHGLGSDLEAWREQLEHFRPSRRAVSYDQRGHGRSDRARDGVYTVDALAADLDAVITALGLGRVVLVGHGDGGPVITAYASAHPARVAGLVYVDAVGDYSVARPEADAMLREEIAPSFGAAERRKRFEERLDAFAKPATRAQVLAALDRLDPPAWAALHRSIAELDAPARLGLYTGPISAMETEMNRSQMLASVVLGVRRRPLRGVSHWAMLDDPAQLDHALDRFLLNVQ